MAKEEEPYSCIATSTRNGTIKTKRVKKDEMVVLNNRTYSLSSPGEWMESVETKEGTHGAYTVLRCDIQTNRKQGVDFDYNTNTIGNIWGEGFHFDRLRSSYEAMFCKSGDESMSMSLALEQSKSMFQYLLNDACDNLTQMEIEKEESKTLMVTLLWQPRPRKGSEEPNSNEESISVRAHAFSSNTASIPMQYSPNPISAAIALSKDEVSSHMNLLPARHNSIPEAKSSSWCRRRRPLIEKFKTKDVGEVLLTMPVPSQTIKNKGECEWELLEGLTSNLFVVYCDGSIRTARDHVLGGYARHLVLEAAERNGLRVSHEPILLSDARRGLWSEIFVTSSIRLVIPLAKLIIPVPDQEEDGSFAFEELWSEPSLDTLSWDTRRWKLLYDDIIKYQCR